MSWRPLYVFKSIYIFLLVSVMLSMRKESDDWKVAIKYVEFHLFIRHFQFFLFYLRYQCFFLLLYFQYFSYQFDLVIKTYLSWKLFIFDWVHYKTRTDPPGTLCSYLLNLLISHTHFSLFTVRDCPQILYKFCWCYRYFFCSTFCQ